MIKILAICAPSLLLAGCATSASNPSTTFGLAQLNTAQGTSVGTARFYPTSAGKLGLQIALVGLPAGRVHGTHLHMVGRCDAPDFASAGGHLNPGGRQHGADNPAGSHLGDLPNITIAPDGTGTANMTIPGEAAGALLSIFDGDGTALVVHAAADDYRTDPSGNSGARIACGSFTRAPI